MRLNLKSLVFFVVFLLVLFVVAWKLGYSLLPGSPPPRIYGAIFPEPKTLAPFSLQRTAGRTFTQKDIQGHWTLVYFGYTHCPDVCPTTMMQFQQMQEKLKKNVPELPVSFVMVTVDPERDTPALMEDYVRHFNTTFTGLSGDPKEIKALAKQLFVGYQRGQDDAAIGYAMYHSDSVLIINPKGQFAAIFSSPHPAKNMTQDFLKVIKYQ